MNVIVEWCILGSIVVMGVLKYIIDRF